jgi:hypothetical protein
MISPPNTGQGRLCFTLIDEDDQRCRTCCVLTSASEFSVWSQMANTAFANFPVVASNAFASCATGNSVRQ